ncbi:MAG TPA: GTPase HflX [Burkholderiales bacterium]|nr:GTPase HflX [Burkholderiales bacterium]
MFERASGGDRAIVVALDLRDPEYAESVEEMLRLADSAGVKVLSVLKGRRQRPDAATFAGKGKVEELSALVSTNDANLVIFNHDLSPAQQRNLEMRTKVRVVDRTSLILDIFAQRARSHEGKLQVELAQLDHLATRLVRGWTHLERQKGGIGLRGPGETQLETDRRLLGKRVRVLRTKLAAFDRQRVTRRRARSRGNVLSVSLVGYTNAGKSTLFNRLTHGDAYAADQLFATLDTTSRRTGTSGSRTIVLSDTVGFIRDLPHTLVAAFRATLEETVRSDLLLHVVDAASPVRDAQIEQVNKVLADIGADSVPQIIVYNKIDLAGLSPGVERDACGKIRAVRLSAATGAGISELRALYNEFQSATVPVPSLALA